MNRPIFGKYHWHSYSPSSGPPPLFGLVIRPRGTWVRVELIFWGRACYITWGHR